MTESPVDPRSDIDAGAMPTLPDAIIPFPPRASGRALESAMRAADAAAAEAVARAAAEGCGADWLNLGVVQVRIEDHAETVALHAAIPILTALTADDEMVAIVAGGIAAEAMRRLRKRGRI